MRPHVGALPYGAVPMAVGVDRRHVFPDSGSPVAEAGDYTMVTDTNHDGWEIIELDGRDWSDPDGFPSSYAWTVNGHITCTAVGGPVAMPVGDHQVFLTVTDNSGNQATDLRQITLNQGPDNLVRNPGFESGPASWDFSQGSGEIMNAPVHFGGQSLAVAGVLEEKLITQQVPITPGAAVTVTGWIRGAEVPPGDTAQIQIAWLDSSGGDLGLVDGVPVSMSKGWLIRTQDLTAPPGAVMASIRLVLSAYIAPGTACYDDLFLAVTDNKVKNAHFEQGAMNWFHGRGAPVVITDPGLARSCSATLQLVGSTNDYQSKYQLLPVNQGQVYTVSGWIKTSNFPAGKYAKLQVQWADANGGYKGIAWTGQVGGSAAYTQVSTALTVPVGSGVTQMKVLPMIDLGATGATAWFDDIYVK